MYSLAVSDHFMIAHRLRGALFGPAQQLHGATYVVEAEFRRARLDEHGLVCDIGLALQVLRETLATFNYRNLDEHPELAGVNTTTEWLAGEVHRRLAARAAQGALGAGTAGALASLRVVLRESPLAWAAYEGPIGA